MSASVVDDFSTYRAFGFNIRRKTTAESSQHVKASSYGNVIEFNREARRCIFARFFSGDVNAAFAEGRVAVHVFDTLLRVVVDQVATRVKIERRRGGEFGAMHASSAEPHGDLRRIGRTVEVKFAGQVSAPAGIGARYETGELAKLRLLPIDIQCRGIWRECGSTSHAGLHAHHAGFFKVQTNVGPGRLSAQADAPLAGTLLPQREIGIDQRKGELLYTVLEIDSRVSSFKVGQRRRPARTR